MKRSERAWRSVLIVDDDRDTREMYCESLRSMGFDAAAASSGEEALRMASEMPPAVVVTDLRFKGRMDGVELARRLRADGRTKNIRIIMLTGASLGPDRDRAEASVCDRFLLKPCLPDALVAEIRGLAAAAVSPGGYDGSVGPHALPKRPSAAKAGPRPERLKN